MEDSVINGVRTDVVAKLSTGVDVDDASDDERAVAKKAGPYLEKMRAKGYGREQCRLAFWNKILSESMKISPSERH